MSVPTDLPVPHHNLFQWLENSDEVGETRVLLGEVSESIKVQVPLYSQWKKYNFK